MLTVSPIKSVNNTPNQVSFGKGVQTNYGISAPTSKNMVESGLITGFFGTVAPKLSQIQFRARSIEKGLDEQKLNYFA